MLYITANKDIEKGEGWWRRQSSHRRGRRKPVGIARSQQRRCGDDRVKVAPYMWRDWRRWPWLPKAATCAPSAERN